MNSYTVVLAGWLEDARGVSALRQPGDSVVLTDAGAEYLVLSGQVARPTTAIKEGGKGKPQYK